MASDEEEEERSGKRLEAQRCRRAGVQGSTDATATTAIAVTASSGLGRLRSGFPAVRMTKTTSTCVASDSTNHPVWNRRSGAWKTRRRMQKVRKS